MKELEARNEHQVGRIAAMERSHRAELAELDAKAEAAEARIAELETQLATAQRAEEELLTLSQKIQAKATAARWGDAT